MTLADSSPDPTDPTNGLRIPFGRMTPLGAIYKTVLDAYRSGPAGGLLLRFG
jgi:hypothetical protein